MGRGPVLLPRRVSDAHIAEIAASVAGGLALPMIPGFLYDTTYWQPVLQPSSNTFLTMSAGRIFLLPAIFADDVTIEAVYVGNGDNAAGGNISMALYNADGLGGALPSTVHTTFGEASWAVNDAGGGVQYLPRLETPFAGGPWNIPAGRYFFALVTSASLKIWGGIVAGNALAAAAGAYLAMHTYDGTFPTIAAPTFDDPGWPGYPRGSLSVQGGEFFAAQVPIVYFRLAA